jgi:hypothetical protein
MEGNHAIPNKTFAITVGERESWTAGPLDCPSESFLKSLSFGYRSILLGSVKGKLTLILIACITVFLNDLFLKSIKPYHHHRSQES